MQSELKICAVILSGGAGRRFDGKDKGLCNYRAKPLIEHVITAISPQVKQLILCVNRNQNAYAQFGLELIQDQQQERLGPLAGVSAAIRHLNKSKPELDAVLISSCDSPALPSDYVKRLSDALIDQQVAVVHDGERRQNLHCLIAREAWPSLLDFFEQGGRAMHRWFEKVDLSEVDFANQKDRFANINSPQQIDTLKI